MSSHITGWRSPDGRAWWACKAPYHESFINDLKAQIPSYERRWLADCKVWVVALNQKDKLEELCLKHYYAVCSTCCANLQCAGWKEIKYDSMSPSFSGRPDDISGDLNAQKTAEDRERERRAYEAARAKAARDQASADAAREKYRREREYQDYERKKREEEAKQYEEFFKGYKKSNWSYDNAPGSDWARAEAERQRKAREDRERREREARERYGNPGAYGPFHGYNPGYDPFKDFDPFKYSKKEEKKQPPPPRGSNGFTMASAAAVLGISVNATATEIKKARRNKAFEAHPDRGGSNERMAEINAAADFMLARVSL